ARLQVLRGTFPTVTGDLGVWRQDVRVLLAVDVGHDQLIGRDADNLSLVGFVATVLVVGQRRSADQQGEGGGSKKQRQHAVHHRILLYERWIRSARTVFPRLGT